MDFGAPGAAGLEESECGLGDDVDFVVVGNCMMDVGDAPGFSLALLPAAASVETSNEDIANCSENRTE